MDNPYLKERAVDVKDLGRRLLEYLQQASHEPTLYPDSAILVGDELTASMLGDFILGTSLIATMPRQLSQSSYRGLAFCEPPLTLPKIRYDLVWHRRNDHSGRNMWLRQAVLDENNVAD